jgi:hypothetical protein
LFPYSGMSHKRPFLKHIQRGLKIAALFMLWW